MLVVFLVIESLSVVDLERRQRNVGLPRFADYELCPPSGAQLLDVFAKSRHLLKEPRDITRRMTNRFSQLRIGHIGHGILLRAANSIAHSPFGVIGLLPRFGACHSPTTLDLLQLVEHREKNTTTVTSKEAFPTLKSETPKATLQDR